MALFSFSQVELPWALGPADGRYLVRRPGEPLGAAPSHVLVFATIGARERHRLGRRRRPAAPEPEPSPVTTGRATVISVAEPFLDATEAGRWLDVAGEQRLAGDLAVLNRALHAFRIVSADPSVHAVGRAQLLVARLGYGDGEQVAAGRWLAARESVAEPPRGRRAKLLEPQARLAAALGGREPVLACAELALRARSDIDAERWREAALQLAVALDAALSELAVDEELAERVDALRGRRAGVRAVAAAALEAGGAGEGAAELGDGEREVIVSALAALEAALRARAFARA